MRSTFGIFNASMKGLFAQQIALDTVGHNISNANTDGFSRQRVDLSATKAEGVATGSGGYMEIGTGVDIKSVSRVRDSFIDQQLWQATSTLAYAENNDYYLSRFGDVFREPSDTGIQQSLNDFWSSWQSLSTNAQSASAQVEARERGNEIAKNVSLAKSQLTQMVSDIDNTLKIKLDSLNSLSKQVLSLNQQITQTETGGNKANDLRDQRDLLIDQLSLLGEVQVNEEKSGSYTVKMAGITLVDGYNRTELKMVNDKSAQLANYYGISVNKIVTQDSSVALNFKNGEIQGLLDMRDSKESGIRAYLDKLDTMSKFLLQDFNRVQRAGYGTDGSHNVNFYGVAGQNYDQFGMKITQDHLQAGKMTVESAFTGTNARDIQVRTTGTTVYSSATTGAVVDVGKDTGIRINANNVLNDYPATNVNFKLTITNAKADHTGLEDGNSASLQYYDTTANSWQTLTGTVSNNVFTVNDASVTKFNGLQFSFNSADSVSAKVPYNNNDTVTFSVQKADIGVERSLKNGEVSAVQYSTDGVSWNEVSSKEVVLDSNNAKSIKFNLLEGVGIKIASNLGNTETFWSALNSPLNAINGIPYGTQYSFKIPSELEDKYFSDITTFDITGAEKTTGGSMRLNADDKVDALASFRVVVKAVDANGAIQQIQVMSPGATEGTTINLNASDYARNGSFTTFTIQKGVTVDFGVNSGNAVGDSFNCDVLGTQGGWINQLAVNQELFATGGTNKIATRAADISDIQRTRNYDAVGVSSGTTPVPLGTTFSGAYTGISSATFTVEVLESQNSFATKIRYKKDNGEWSYVTSSDPKSQTGFTLQNGLTISFPSTGAITANSTCTFSVDAPTSGQTELKVSGQYNGTGDGEFELRIAAVSDGTDGFAVGTVTAMQYYDKTAGSWLTAQIDRTSTVPSFHLPGSLKVEVPVNPLNKAYDPANPTSSYDTFKFKAIDGKGSGNNAVNLSQRLKGDISSNLGGVTLDNYYSSVVGGLGTQGQSAYRMKENQKVIVKQVENWRSSVSGVNMDEEMTNMIKYQKSYNASARMVSTINQMMDTLINGLGK